MSDARHFAIDDVVRALALPDRARVDQRVPKKMLAQHGAATATDRRLLTDGIEELQWIAALKPGTVAIPEYRGDGREYLEVAVLSVQVRATHGKTSQLLRLAELVHRAVPYPVVLIQALVSGTEAETDDSPPTHSARPATPSTPMRCQAWATRSARTASRSASRHSSARWALCRAIDTDRLKSGAKDMDLFAVNCS